TTTLVGSRNTRAEPGAASATDETDAPAVGDADENDPESGAPADACLDDPASPEPDGSAERVDPNSSAV
ncbi:MAG: hypothetical protein M3186_12720, partial [Actinomycetota bacterium]|nr:hypothetical protein [Actinomycetota bacterium]